MKCSQCGRRNSSDNSFCGNCAAPITKLPKAGRKLVPPQDLTDTVSGRDLNLPKRKSNWTTVALPLVVVALAIVVAYWAVYYSDVYEVEAIEYYPDFADEQ